MKTSWRVTTATAWSAAKVLCGWSVLGAALAGCSVDANLDVINGCDTDIRVYSGTNNARSGTAVRVDDLSPHETAATYVSDGNAVIYVQPTGTDTWVGPLVVPADADGDGLVTYVVQADACAGLPAG